MLLSQALVRAGRQGDGVIPLIATETRSRPPGAPFRAFLEGREPDAINM